VALDLDAEQVKKILTHFHSKGLLERGCTACGTKGELKICNKPAAILLREIGGETHGDLNYPCIAVICESCGNFNFFSTISMGLEVPDKKEDDGPPISEPETEGVKNG